MSETVQTEAVAIRPNYAVAEALGINEILAQVRLVQEVMHEVMKEGEHYGAVPGCGPKKTLLQPGAQKLTMTFRLAPNYEIQERDLEGGHKEYRVICTLKTIQSGTFVGQGVGCCSTMESKYRFRQGVRKCPKCGKESIIKGKEEYGGGWLCWTKKEGCGAKWPDGSPEIEGQSVERVENDNPADTYNTVLKMAKKRAFVDATITATAASDIFTQDIGDDETDQVPETPKAPPPPPESKPAAPQPPAPPRLATEATRKWMIEKLGDLRDAATDYFQTIGKLPGDATLGSLPLDCVPTTQTELRALIAKLDQIPGMEPAKKPIEVPRDDDIDPNSPSAPWRTFLMPWGKEKGKELAKLDKKYLWGLWMNYTVQEEFNGKPRPAEMINADRRLRKMLDEAGKHYDFKKPSE